MLLIAWENYISLSLIEKKKKKLKENNILVLIFSLVTVFLQISKSAM